MKQIIESQLVGDKQDGYSTSVVVNLNSELPRTNPTTGQGETWTQAFQITSPAL